MAGLGAGVLLGTGSVANADVNRDLPTLSEPVDATASADATQHPASGKRYVVRMRLDDGRYRGFRQHGTDELRTDDRVIVETDRIEAERRAQRKGDAYR
jgi:hypothetical protein